MNDPERAKRQDFEDSVSESTILKGAQNEVAKLIHANKVNRRAWQIIGSLFIVFVVVVLIFAKSQYDHFEGQYKMTMASQAAVGRQVELRLCQSFGKIADLQPPPGDAGTNPSRAYEQQLHGILAGVYVDLGCTEGR
jgi:hypothetical protein